MATEQLPDWKNQPAPAPLTEDQKRAIRAEARSERRAEEMQEG